MKAWRSALVIGLLTPALPAAGVARLPGPATARQPSPVCQQARGDAPAPAFRLARPGQFYPDAAGAWLSLLGCTVHPGTRQ
jgi:hypothetical protein